MPRKKNWKRSVAQKEVMLTAKLLKNNTKVKQQEHGDDKVDAHLVQMESGIDHSGLSENSLFINQCKHTVQGTFHQGDVRFLQNSGKQCVANSLTSIMYSRIKDISLWRRSDLDKILQTGNELYGYLQASSTMHDEYLLISELPDEMELFDTYFELPIRESLVGVIGENPEINDEGFDDFVVTLYSALHTVLSESYACFVTFGANTFAIIQKDNLYYIFDPHSRNEEGLQVPDGRSILIQASSIQEMYQQCTDLARSMNISQTQFEITPIDVRVRTIESSKASNTESTNRQEHNEDILTFDPLFASPYTFLPLTLKVKRHLCKFLSIMITDREATSQLSCHKLGEPIDTRHIQADGNCFFRSLSYAISGSENHHKIIRTAVINHMRKNETIFYSHLRPGYASINEYIQSSRMQCVGTWATEVEILVAADLLQTDIYIFSDTWLRFSCKQLCKNKICQEESIYLKHCNQSHYEVILSVKDEAYETYITKCTDEKLNLEGQSVKTESVFHEQLKHQSYKRRYNVCSDDVPEGASKRPKTVYHPITVLLHQKQNEQSSTSAENIPDTSQFSRTPEILNKRKRQRKADNFRYNTDVGYKERKRQAAKDRYRYNPSYRETVKIKKNQKYKTDDEYKRKLIKQGINKYKTDNEYNIKLKMQSVRKYKTNDVHRKNVKAQSIQKYKTDENHEKNVKAQSIQKYKTDKNHKKNVKAQSIQKYKTDENHKKNVKAQSIQKYKSDPEHRENVNAKSKVSRTERNIQKQNIKYVISSFKEEIVHGLEYVCCVCNRLMFRHQVVHCKEKTYHAKGNAVGSIATKCISYKHVHSCKESCCNECSPPEHTKLLWICYTCHRKILSSKVPAEAVVNNLNVQPIPEKLKCLNTLEQHLIALHIPFIKMMALPKGGQHGVHGPMVCVPSNIKKSTELLPRFEADDQTIRVKLKRKLCYKGYYQYQFVNKIHLQEALEYLKQNNKWYVNVEFNNEWENTLSENIKNDKTNSKSNQIDKLTDNTANITDCTNESVEKLNNESVVDDDNDESEERLKGMLLDTCLQPVDIGQEVLDQHFDDIFCIAPAQGNSPVSILMDEGNEAKCFPTLYPEGSPTFTDERDEKITLGRYLHCRLMNADTRFASNTDYIFYAQYISELNQVLSNVSIALRKGQGIERKLTSKMLAEEGALQSIFKSDEGYKFLKPIRGTPPFWQSAQKDLFAMIRQLGIPTWFCSFSSADMRWSELIETILKQHGDMRKANDLDWTEKCEILRNNPVTAARMFDHRFHYFLKRVIMSAAEPIGKIKDFFYRIEFQQRGSPHTHCLFWVEDAPKVDKDNDETVASFVDKYISCKLPEKDQDEELHEIVSSVQRHSSNHSKSCKKMGTTCRFNFPRPPSKHTFICRAIESNDRKKDIHNGSDKDGMDGPIVETSKVHSSKDIQSAEIENSKAVNNESWCKNDNTKEREPNNKNISLDEAKLILEKLWKAISDGTQNYKSVDDLFSKIGLSQELFQKASQMITKKSNLVLQRRPSDIWINQYNEDLLRCWNANMDIQFVFDAYSCVVYIVSYISKAEREMGLLLDQAQREAREDGNTNAKAAMKKLGSVYLHNREISAQEAVYRVCNLTMKEGSRKVQYIPAGNDPIKLSLPLKLLQNKSRGTDLEEGEIWMTNLVDRYKALPREREFDSMCLASFCSEYRVLSNPEVRNLTNKSTIIELENGLGFVKKRSRTGPAVIRYPRFSATRTPEKYYHCILQLFLPYHLDSQLKPPNFESYEDFFNLGAVCLCGETKLVKEIVDKNRSVFEKESESIDRAQEALTMCVPLEDAWAQICPETEAERLDCQHTKVDITGECEDDDVPDLKQSEKRQSNIELHTSIIPRRVAEPLLRSLNNDQSEIFYQIRQWCLDKVHGKNPEPFHIFLTGGAGTGKSHLIKTIYYEATRILACILPNPDDSSVLMTAPTGVAAFNIGAHTIHSAFSIRIDAKLPYQPLGDDKANSLRAKLGSLEILIIDEISMVDHKLLCYIHGRLRQIKQTRDFSPFGNVSILAVGDFYQLPPVKGKPLYIDCETVNLWEGQFCIAELNQIMRQKEDLKFAQTLNRLRIRKKSEGLNTEDVALLRSREMEGQSDAMYMFATNSQVDQHNIESLHVKCSNPICIEAQDFSRNPKTAKLEMREVPHVRVFTTNLSKCVTLAEGARVMLTKNIDVSDGLVNGVFGTVAHITLPAGKTFPKSIYVCFDEERVGLKLRCQSTTCSSIPQSSTCIEAHEDIISNNGSVRRQFALKLAWACTVHKVQGITVEKANVSFDRIFAPGQAYVALSRVSSASGLTIQNFNEDVIFCNEKIEQSLQNMSRVSKSNIRADCAKRIIMMHNIQGLQPHYEDLKNDRRFQDADFICLTETWLAESGELQNVYIENFMFYNNAREKCYDRSNRLSIELQQQAHGGVGFYRKNINNCEILTLNVRNLEYVAFMVRDMNVSVVVVYRPQTYTADLFNAEMQVLLDQLRHIASASIVMGDFNQNILLGSSSIQHFMNNNGYTQMIDKVTTEGGTLLDHVYCRGFNNIKSVKVTIVPTYFSYHEAIRIELC